jgi:hypothetical protein
VGVKRQEPKAGHDHSRERSTKSAAKRVGER